VSPAQQLRQRWKAGQRPDVRQALADAGDLAPEQAAGLLRVDQQERWRRGEPVPAETYLQLDTRVQGDVEAAVELIYSEFLLREAGGQAPTLSEYELRFPRYADRLRVQIELHLALTEESDPKPAADQARTAPSADNGPAAAAAGIAASGPDLCGPVLGPYVVLERLGAGGMGQVYKARHQDLDRLVALKVLRQDRCGDPEAVQRFQREIKIVAQLSHPNLVLAYDASCVDDLCFLAMEYVEGTDLARRVRRHGPLPVPLSCEVIRQAALGLAHAHERGLVHRDIKPSNLMLLHRHESIAHERDGEPDAPARALACAAGSASNPGVVKVLDLGLACWHLPGPEHSSSLLTETGAVLGTPDFLAPEQARDARKADPRSDLYSLGCTFYYLLTGQVPLPAATLTEKLLRHQMDDPVPVERLRPDVPAEVAAVVGRLMAKRPEERFPSAAAVAEVLLVQALGPPAAIRGGCHAFAAPQVVEQTSNLRGAAKACHPYRHGLLHPFGRGGAGLRRAGVALSGVAAFLVLLFLSVGAFRSADTGTPTFRGPSAEQRRRELLELRRSQPGTPAALEAARQLCQLPSPFDGFRPEQIPPHERLEWQPKELVAIFGEHRLRTWAWANALTLSPNGKWLAGGGHMQAIHIWDTSTGYELKLLQGPDFLDSVGALTFSPDGRLLAAAYRQSSYVRLWDTGTWTELGLLQGHGQKVNALVFAPDSEILATASDDGTVRLWQVGRDHGRPLPRVAEASGDGTVRLGHVDGGRTLPTLAAHADGVRCVAFSADGRTLATGGKDKLVKVWDVASGQEQSAFPGHKSPVVAVAFGGDGQTLASVSEDLVLARWDLRAQQPIASRQVPAATGQANAVAFSPDGQTLAWVRKGENRIHFTRVDSGKETRFLATPRCCHAISFSPDGKTLAANKGHTDAALWDVASGQEVLSVDGVAIPFRTVALAPDDSRIALPGMAGTVRLYDLAAGAGPTTLPGHSSTVIVLRFAPDAKYLFSASADRTSRLWDLVTNPVRIASRSLGGDSNQLAAAAFSPDGQTLATLVQEERQIRLWVPATGEVRTVIPLPVPLSHQGLAFSPTSELLAWKGSDGVLRLWEVATGQEQQSFQEGISKVARVAFAPDGRSLASVLGGHADHVGLRDVATGQIRATTMPQRQDICSAAYSPDGRLLAISNEFGQITLNDASTGAQLRQWQLPGAVNEVVFSSDSRHLLTANENGTAYVLRLEAAPSG
jgi:WD40 repeat protein/serine/threonine protein kinase